MPAARTKISSTETNVLIFICSCHCTPVEGRQEGGLLAPAVLHLDMTDEIDMAAEEPLHFLARLGADIFQHGAARANDNALLAAALDVHGGVDADEVWGIFPGVHGNGHRVGHFFARDLQDFFAD